MRIIRVIAAVVVLSAAVLTAATRAEDKKEDKDKIAGTWTVQSAERGGQANDNIKGDTLTFTGDKFEIKTKNGLMKGTIKLDPTTKPKLVDLDITEGEGKGESVEGIYQLEGDELKLCMSQPGLKERPTEFATKEGERRMLIVLKREK